MRIRFCCSDKVQTLKKKVPRIFCRISTVCFMLLILPIYRNSHSIMSNYRVCLFKLNADFMSNFKKVNTQSNMCVLNYKTNTISAQTEWV